MSTVNVNVIMDLPASYKLTCIYRQVHVHAGMPGKFSHYMQACFARNYLEALSYCGHGHHLTSVMRLWVPNIIVQSKVPAPSLWLHVYVSLSKCSVSNVHTYTLVRRLRAYHSRMPTLTIDINYCSFLLLRCGLITKPSLLGPSAQQLRM